MQTEPKSRRGILIAVIMLGVVGGGLAGGVFMASRLFERRGRTDVGGLEALASVQAQLRAVEACRIEHNYNNPGKYRELYRRIVFLTPCGAEELHAFKGRVDLPEPWAHGGLAFEARRSSVKEDWTILVDTQQVPFPVLAAGLGELAPHLVREAPAALVKARAEEAAGAAAYEENQRRLQQERERNQGSYPPR
jgi:hypothetical protein